MEVVELEAGDREAAAALWDEAGLTRPWNDPLADFDRALAGATSTVLGIRRAGDLVGTVMVGHDGHRGWVYYLAVARSDQGMGAGTALMGGAEAWLRSMGAVKSQLMVRTSNLDATRFYERLGYERSDVDVLARWLDIP